MKFLAIDTSGKRLIVAAVNGRKKAVCDEVCPMQHSVCLFPAIDGAVSRAELSLRDCDFLACTVGPGSFTGIRIGISAVKGLCFGAEKNALAVTSFAAIAYAEKTENKIAVVDAGHGFVYAEGYGSARLPCGYYSGEEVLRLASKTGAALLCAEEFDFPARVVDAAKGLIAAARASAGKAGSAEQLAALYLRRSSAEEGR